MLTPPASVQTAPVSVVEINPYAPRPFVFTDLALCLFAALRGGGLAVQLVMNTLPAAVPCIVRGWTPAWLAEHDAALDPRRIVLNNADALPAPKLPADS